MDGNYPQSCDDNPVGSCNTFHHPEKYCNLALVLN